jgi:hypothetical protein
MGFGRYHSRRSTHQSSAGPPLSQGNSRVLAVRDAPDHTSHTLPALREALPVPPVHIGTLEGKPGVLANAVSTDIISKQHMSPKTKTSRMERRVPSRFYAPIHSPWPAEALGSWRSGWLLPLGMLDVCFGAVGDFSAFSLEWIVKHTMAPWAEGKDQKTVVSIIRLGES